MLIDKCSNTAIQFILTGWSTQSLKRTAWLSSYRHFDVPKHSVMVTGY